jgi:hypothetical protein
VGSRRRKDNRDFAMPDKGMKVRGAHGWDEKILYSI